MTWPFDDRNEKNTLISIRAAGFPHPVPGIIYEGQSLKSGMPLGGLGTGYFSLEGNGHIGFYSIYNDLVPPARWFRDWLVLRIGTRRIPLSLARISFWGHYPVADLVAHFKDVPISLGLRVFSPFLPGQAAESNTPAALFTLRLHNTGAQTMHLGLDLSFPAPKNPEDKAILTGKDLKTMSDSTRATTAIELEPGATKELVFCFAWHAPHWRDSGNEAHVHRYAQRFSDADSAASSLLSRHTAVLERILAWQQVIYAEDRHPDWLRDALVQSFYSLAKNSIWIARTRADEWWGEEGWFSHNESHTGCPITETMVCRMHGHFPVLFFFPDLEAGTLHAFRHFQISDGEIPFSFGLGTSLRDPRYHCQHPLNSGQYAQMIYRLYRRTGDRNQLAGFYPSAKNAIRYQFSLDTDGDGLVNDQPHVRPGEHWPANQFYDIWPWWGTSAYVAGTWLATLRVGQAMARVMDDKGFEEECTAWLSRGQKAFEKLLWNGSYYRLWNDPANKRSSEVCLANQLMAEWCTRIAGLSSVLAPEHIDSALNSISSLNRAATAFGLVNGVNPDGTPHVAGGEGENDHSRQIFFGESLCAAMTFLYHGQTEIGLDIAQKLVSALFVTARSPWNQTCLIHTETGLPVWGDDYYSNMVIWAVPMAISGQHIEKFTAPGGFIDTIVR